MPVPSVGYPRRSADFFELFSRLVFDAPVGAELGPHALVLLLRVARQEHESRYCGPVSFYPDWLQTACGLKAAAFRRARDRAVASGWLVYEAGERGAAGRYYVAVPDGVDPSDRVS